MSEGLMVILKTGIPSRMINPRISERILSFSEKDLVTSMPTVTIF
jgi:hypothetical protein